MSHDYPKAFRTQSYIFKRYIWLLSLLYDGKRLSFEEISEKWMHSSLNDDGAPFPRRTFRDHLDAIQEIFDIIICNENKGSYRYYIEDGEDLDSNLLSKWMLDNFTLSNTLADARDIEDRILLQDIPSSKKWLSSVIQAIRDKNVLIVEYTSYTRGKTPTLELCPFFLKLYDSRWYLYARNLTEPMMKQYALDRIDDLTISEKKFDFEPSEADRQSLEYCFGHSIYPDIEPREIFIKATGTAPFYLDALPLHKSQKKVKEAAGYAIYKYYFAPTPEFEATLLKWNGKLKVVSENECEAIEEKFH